MLVFFHAFLQRLSERKKYCQNVLQEFACEISSRILLEISQANVLRITAGILLNVPSKDAIPGDFFHRKSMNILNFPRGISFRNTKTLPEKLCLNFSISSFRYCSTYSGIFSEVFLEILLKRHSSASSSRGFQ